MQFWMMIIILHNSFFFFHRRIAILQADSRKDCEEVTNWEYVQFFGFLYMSRIHSYRNVFFFCFVFFISVDRNNK